MKVFSKVDASMMVTLSQGTVAAATATAQSEGKALVVLSSGPLPSLSKGKVYATDLYLSGLYVPLTTLPFGDSGQQPLSDYTFADAFPAKLGARAH